ncbi:MAG TPA: hypothetical protein VGG09_16350 [Acidimicrobiales bacterium]
MADSERRSTPSALVDRILHGAGHASPERRTSAFNNEHTPDSLGDLIDKVAACSAQITDADFAGAAAAGFGDDGLFELVICAAVGQANRQYEAALAALAAATEQAKGA